MIVFDASSLVGAAIGPDRVPRRALHRARGQDRFALSKVDHNESTEVLHRPRLARFIDATLRDELLDLLGFHPWRGVRILRPAEYPAALGLIS